MARGTQLQQLRTMLRAEVGHSTNVAAGVDNIPALNQKLSRCQIMLYDAYDWPFLREKFDITLQAGQRYYDFPTAGAGGSAYGLSSERVEKTAINYSGRPSPIDKGIDFEEYAQYNSDNGDRASPARRWDVRRTSDAKEQIEIWPIPADNTQIFSLKGIRNLRPLVADTDVCDLDDILIVLTAGAEIVARENKKDAALMRSAAAARLAQLEGRLVGPARMITMSGSSASSDQMNRGKTIIRIGS